MRLIDADKLTEHIKDLPTWWADDGGYYPGSMKYPDGMFCPEDVISSIENAPSVDAVEVVHGRWEWVTEDIYKCSNCGEKAHVKEVMGQPAWDYCPNCGAKMDGERKCGE